MMSDYPDCERTICKGYIGIFYGSILLIRNQFMNDKYALLAKKEKY